jgi:secernin
MGSDMVVALARATADGRMLFGHNSNRPPAEGHALVREPGRAFAPGESVSAGAATLPQVRQTYTVLGCRRAGQWGYAHGVNEHGVAAGVTAIRTRLSGGAAGLSGTDLVRLALERAAGARQAADVLTDLVARHGQRGPAGDGEPADSAFLVADPREAFVLEAAGPFWAEQAVGAARAVSGVCHLRQDWDRIARGLADRAIDSGWWPANGSKLDFAGAVGREQADHAAGLRRWGRATLLLEQHRGAVDGPFLRRLLADHCDMPPEADLDSPARTFSLCRHPAGPEDPGTSASLVVEAGPAGALPVAWCACGLPCTGVWFPLFLAGDLPEAFAAEGTSGASRVWRRMQGLAGRALRAPDRGANVREAFATLQEQFDQEARAFLADAAVLQQHGEGAKLHLLAGSLMQHNLERWENLCDEVCPAEWRPGRVPHGSECEYAASGD